MEYNDELYKTLDSGWDNLSGLNVEDYIKTRFKKTEDSEIASVEYADENLKITTKGGSTYETSVSVITPVYNAELSIDGIYISGKKSDSKTINYINGKKYELGVWLHRTATRTDTPTDIMAPSTCYLEIKSQGITIVNLIKYTVNPVSGEDYGTKNPYLIDITDLLSQISESGVEFILSYNLINGNDEIVISGSYDDVSVINPKIKYAGSTYVVDANNILFTLSGISVLDKSNFIYEVWNNGVRSSMDGNSKDSFTNLLEGLNKINIRAYHSKIPTISTEWLSVDVIYTNNNTYKQTVIAINLVPSLTISNQAVSNLYKVDVYSQDKLKVEITTYIEDESINNLDLFKNAMEKITISPEDYDSKTFQYSRTFSAYIEITTAGKKYLGIKTEYGNVSEFYIRRYVLTITGQDNSPLTSLYWVISISAPDRRILPYSDIEPNLNFSQTTNSLNNVFVNLSENLNVEDGYRLLDGKNVFYISSSKVPLYNSGSINTYFNSSSEFTFEIGLTSLNVSSEDLPILTMGKLQIKPTEVCWQWDNVSDPEKKIYLNRNAGFNVDEDTNIIITYRPKFKISQSDPYYPTYMGKYLTNFNSYTGTIDLLTIYINGVVAREIALTENDKQGLSNELSINPTSSDVAISCLKTWNTHALTESEIRQEYIAFLRTIEDKLTFYEKNNILNDGEISWNKARKLFNTLVYIYPKGSQVLTRACGGDDNKDNPVEGELKKHFTTLFVNYANPEVNAIYGGRINKLLRKAQGSSAKRYWIWNVQDQMNKFTKDTLGHTFYSVKEKKRNDGSKYYSCKATDGVTYEINSKDDIKDVKSEFISYSNDNFDSVKNEFKEDATPKDSYLLPLDSDNTGTDGLEVTKLVGKVNFASSMQSHKLGACELYNATNPTSLNSSSRKAVKELPYLYFYYISELDDVSDIQLSDIIKDDKNIKFLGLMTWGSGKCDKATWDCKDKDVLVIEGAENEDLVCAFLVPWLDMQRKGSDGHLSNIPQINLDASKQDPLANIMFYNESLFYKESTDMLQASWDIDTNVNDDGDGLKSDLAKESIKRFRDFYDTVYLYDFSILFDTKLSGTDTHKKVCITSQNLTGFSDHKPYDIYRYDTINKKWVQAGLDCSNGIWSRLNLEDLAKESSSYNEGLDSKGLAAVLKSVFKTKIAEYIDILDVAHHLAVIKFLSGTDNRNKNTYFKVKNTGKILMYQDDLDTIMITDNQGKLSKPYNLIEPAYDETLNSYWGDDGRNLFFRNFDLAFELEIKDLLVQVLTKEKNNSILEKHFWGTLKYFPAVAWNHTATIFYELGQLVKDSNALTDGIKENAFYKNNGEEPITLSHGRYLEGEQYFMNKRNNFLSSYAKYTPYYASDLTLADAGGAGNSWNSEIKFSTFQDIYPIIQNRSDGGNKYILNPTIKSGYDIIDYKMSKDIESDDIKMYESQSILLALPHTTLYKTLKIVGYNRNEFDGTFSHLTSLTIDNVVAKLKGYLEAVLSKISAKFPVIETLNFIGLTLPSEFDAREFEKLKTLNLSKCTNISKVMLPKTLSLTSITLPASIHTLDLSNNPAISNVNLENWDSLTELLLPYIKRPSSGTYLIEDILGKLNKPLNKLIIGSKNSLITINISEQLLSLILNCKTVEIYGTINIVKDDGLLATVSWDTAKLIFRNKNKLSYSTLNYNKTSISNPVFKELEINASSLDCDLLDYINVSNGNNILSVQAFAGSEEIPDAIVKTSSYSSTRITMSVNGISVRSPESSQNVTLIFKEILPQVGFYAFADGSFSSKKGLTKTCIGIVWAINNDDVYIIGTDSIGSYLGGPDFSYANTSSSISGTTNLNYYRDSDNIKVITSLSNNLTLNDVDSNKTFPSKQPVYSSFNGKENTYKIRSAVDNISLSGISNTTVLEAYKSSLGILQSIENQNDSRLIIDSVDKSLALCPYYYAATVYLPNINIGEKLHKCYEKGNWYVPSIYEWLYVYTMYTASKLSSFTMPVNETSVPGSSWLNITPSDINDTNTNNSSKIDGVLPIFAWTKDKINWQITDKLLTSTMASNKMNSWVLQQVNSDYYSSNLKIAVGEAKYLEYSSGYGSIDAGSYHCSSSKHPCIPFVIFNKNNAS